MIEASCLDINFLSRLYLFDSEFRSSKASTGVLSENTSLPDFQQGYKRTYPVTVVTPLVLNVREGKD